MAGCASAKRILPIRLSLRGQTPHQIEGTCGGRITGPGPPFPGSVSKPSRSPQGD